jgi:hypothetical protein
MLSVIDMRFSLFMEQQHHQHVRNQLKLHMVHHLFFFMYYPQGHNHVEKV